MPNVDFISHEGNRDLTYQDIRVRIKVHEKGEMVFGDLTPNSFIETSEIVLGCVR